MISVFPEARLLPFLSCDIGLTVHQSQAQSQTSSDEMSQLFQWRQASATAHMNQGRL